MQYSVVCEVCVPSFVEIGGAGSINGYNTNSLTFTSGLIVCPFSCNLTCKGALSTESVAITALYCGYRTSPVAVGSVDRALRHF